MGPSLQRGSDYWLFFLEDKHVQTFPADATFFETTQPPKKNKLHINGDKI